MRMRLRLHGFAIGVLAWIVIWASIAIGVGLWPPPAKAPELYEIEERCAIECGPWNAGAIVDPDTHAFQCVCMFRAP